jgi:hypothetical protein
VDGWAGTLRREKSFISENTKANGVFDGAVGFVF